MTSSLLQEINSTSLDLFSLPFSVMMLSLALWLLLSFVFLLFAGKPKTHQ